MVLLAPPVSAADFFAIVDNFGRKARNAYLDVAIDGYLAGGTVDVTVDAFDSIGDHISSFTLRTNESGFASTASFGNLFDLTGGQPMLIRARTPVGIERPAAVLHIDALGAPLIVGLWPTAKHDGTALGAGKTFAIALGTFKSASLQVANISGSDVATDVFKVTASATGTGIYTKPRLGANAIWKVDLSQNETLSNLVVTATDWIIVQIVIDDGRSVQSFMVPPTV
jgi:hypothetical protein